MPEARRVAVLSDVHAVLPALEAVLDEPDVRAADLIVLTGDIAAGPMPVETLDVLRALGDRALWIRGNCDRAMVSWARTGLPAEASMEAWAAGTLRDECQEHVRLLDNLPFDATVDIAGLGPAYFCHATPRDDEERVGVDATSELFGEVVAAAPDEAELVVCGHTHMPFARQVKGRMVLNPGSVGMPFGRPGAHWALLGEGVGVALRRTVYDVAAATERVVAACDFRVREGAAAYGIRDAEAWARTYLTGSVAESDVLARIDRRAT